MTKPVSLVVAAIFLLTLTWQQNALVDSQACTGFPWTLQWQQCFQNMMSNVRKNTMDVIKNATANGSGVSMSSSSSNGGISTVSMTVGKTRWTIKAFGVRLVSSSVAGSIVVQSVIGNPEFMQKTILNAEELKLDFVYPMEANIPPKWITVKVENGPTANEVEIKRKNDVVIIQSP